ncbi:MAG: aminotransferase class I/II-fold pyridoxal phosphate-dependent enzyme [Pirellulaceae bacterium]|nr:aminotransferase class I/II-fold pyridoxal phosphate-dependent enzyme [Pirellulaceae bacterium]MDG2104333.1 aminotransferase class I/II-fold pyridoxal phosphate-dependent enzyme [Pirellulaceae bacterium]
MVQVSNWLANRTSLFDSSGIREVFNLAKELKDPINFSIGQVDYPLPEPVKDSLIQSIERGQTNYTVTQGIAPLRERLKKQVQEQYEDPHRDLLITSGTSGGLVLSMMALIDPGDEVIIFDPWFVMYESLPQLCGGVPVKINIYPDFRLDIQKVRDAITPRTKMIITNCPANPTGISFNREEIQQLSELAAEQDICLISDEIYSKFSYDKEHVSPVEFNPETTVVDGFSKSHAMTGLRLGFAHGPAPIIAEMIKLQQLTFVCAPNPVQWAGVTAIDTPIDHHVDAFRKKRDYLADELSKYYDFVKPDGSFYFFPKLPNGVSGREFLTRAIEHNMLLIPGNVFSDQDTHFRIAYAVSESKLQQGVDVLKKIASS